MLPGMAGAIAGASDRGIILPKALTYQSVVGSSADGTNYSFASQSFGAVADPINDRWLLACIMGCADAAPGDIASCTIGGNPATRLFSAGSAGRPMAVFGRLNNDLTSGVVAPIFEQTQVHAASAVFQLINPVSSTPTDSRTASDTDTNVSTTLTVPAGGVGHALCSPNVNSGTLSWTNATEAFELNVDGGGNTFVGGALRPTAGLVTITATQVEIGNVIQILVGAWN
jgi:hypothetical protein